MQSKPYRSSLRVTKIFLASDPNKLWAQRFYFKNWHMWPNLTFMAIGFPMMCVWLVKYLDESNSTSDVTILFGTTLVALLKIALVLLCVHEATHFLAYWFCGVRGMRLNIGWKWPLRFAVEVPDRLVSARATVIAMLAPGVLSLISLVGCFFAPTSGLRCVFATVLAINSAGSNWDWYLASFTIRNSSIAYWEDDTAGSKMIGYS